MHRRTNIWFYAKVDARDILEPQWQQYADHANYIQHRVLVGRTFWEVDDQTNKFTLLKYDYLKNIIHDRILTPLLLELRRCGLIERDLYYQEGKKCYGYRIGDSYANRDTIRVECRSRRLSDRIRDSKRDDYRSYAKVHQHLLYWLRQVDLDLPTAMRIVEEIQYEENKLTLQELRDLNRLAVHAIVDKELELTVCHLGRVHTNITRLIKPVRKELRISGAPLIAIDIANSQPLILTSVILGSAGYRNQTYSSCESFYFQNFGMCKSTNQEISKSPQNPTPTNLTTYTTRNVDISSCNDNGLVSFPEDLDQWKRLCESGVLYPYLMDRMNWQGTKAQFKDKELFRLLYGRNTPFDRDGNYNPSQLQPVLETDFPSVWTFIRKYKRAHGYRELAREMQRQESRLMIQGACGRLMDEHHDCPVVTIHDSILTTEPWVSTVSTAIKYEFGQIGIQPTLAFD